MIPTVRYTILLLSLFTWGYSQEVSVPKERFDSVMSESTKKTEKLPRRITTVTKNYSDSKLKNTVTLMEEYSGDSVRTLSVTDEGGARESTEKVTVAGAKYERINGGEWRKIDASLSQQMRMDVLGRPSTNFDEFLLVNSTINGAPVAIYLSFHVMGSDNSLFFIQNRNWIDAKGFLLKSEVRGSSLLPENVVYESSTTYEYNPKDLKIEAPIN